MRRTAVFPLLFHGEKSLDPELGKQSVEPGQSGRNRPKTGILRSVPVSFRAGLGSGIASGLAG